MTSIPVRSAVLTAYYDVARELNFNPAPALREVGLSPGMLRDPDQRIPNEAAIELLEISAAMSGFAFYGLRMAELRQLSDMGRTSLLITHQRTVREAIQATIQFRHLLNESLAMAIEETESIAVIREELMTERPQRQAIELALGVLTGMCAEVAGPKWQPRRIQFAHSAPKDLSFHRRVFPCGVDFDSDCNGIVCPVGVLDAPNLRANPAMARYAQQFLETLPQLASPSTSLEVRRAIYLGLPSGRASIECVAQSLGHSVRTMQRLLTAERVQFSDLLQEVRRQMARRFIDGSEYSIGRVADLLGYSTPGSFTRWYLAQFGTSPREHRHQQRTANQSVD